MNPGELLQGGVSVFIVMVVVVFVIVLAILWFIMPFAIFGTKPILRGIAAQQVETNRLLQVALKELEKSRVLLDAQTNVLEAQALRERTAAHTKPHT